MPSQINYLKIIHVRCNGFEHESISNVSLIDKCIIFLHFFREQLTDDRNYLSTFQMQSRQNFFRNGQIYNISIINRKHFDVNDNVIRDGATTVRKVSEFNQ